jgi:hypothetical protein
MSREYAQRLARSGRDFRSQVPVLPVLRYPRKYYIRPDNGQMKIPTIKTTFYVSALFRPNLYGIPVDGQCWIRLHVLVEFAFEAGLSQQNRQIVRINLVRKRSVGWKIMAFGLLGDTGLEGTFYGVTGEIVGAFLVSTS